MVLISEKTASLTNTLITDTESIVSLRTDIWLVSHTGEEMLTTTISAYTPEPDTLDEVEDTTERGDLEVPVVPPGVQPSVQPKELAMWWFRAVRDLDRAPDPALPLPERPLEATDIFLAVVDLEVLSASEEVAVAVEHRCPVE